MKKIVYTRPDGGVSIIHPAAKHNIEKVMGPMTDAEYEAHVLARSIPADATNVRYIDDADIPTDREFRNAWVDVTEAKSLDVCCNKAKEVALEKLRLLRNKALESTDIEMTRALEDNDQGKVTALREKRMNLRNVTEELKAVPTTGKVNDEDILTQLKTLANTLPN